MANSWEDAAAAAMAGKLGTTGDDAEAEGGGAESSGGAAASSTSSAAAGTGCSSMARADPTADTVEERDMMIGIRKE